MPLLWWHGHLLMAEEPPAGKVEVVSPRHARRPIVVERPRHSYVTENAIARLLQFRCLRSNLVVVFGLSKQPQSLANGRVVELLHVL
jgi:hypothetical protein